MVVLQSESAVAAAPRRSSGRRAARHHAEPLRLLPDAAPTPCARRGVSCDQLGAWASALCVLHCIALPLLLPTLALSGWSAGWLACCAGGDTTVHLLLYCLVVPIAAIALASGYRHHRRGRVLLLGGLGLLLLSLALLAAPQHDQALYERLLTVAGSLVLIAAHAQNQRRDAR